MPHGSNIIHSMNILISGINGYIGSYLADYLIKHGFCVDGIIRRDIESINYLNNEILLYKSDILEIEDLNLGKEYDYFIHLAAANDVDSKDDKKALLYTSLGTKKCLDFCLKNNITKFIYFSTFQVYGTDHGFITESSQVNCNNDYSITHFFAEEYIKSMKYKSIEYIIFRPTNIYGAALSRDINRDTLVPTCFCLSALEKSEVNLLSSGKQYRNFISLNELSFNLLKTLENFETNKNNIYNIAGKLNLKIYDVANLVVEVYTEMYQKKCTLNILSEYPKEIKRLEVGTSKLENLSSDILTMKDEIKNIFKLYEGRNDRNY